MVETQTAVGATIDGTFVEQFARRWYEAWNSHNVDSVLACLAENIVYDNSAWPTTMRGHAEVRQFLESAWRAFPDMHFETVDGPYLDPGGHSSAGYWRCTATQTGRLDPPGLAATGRRIAFEGAEFWEFLDGKMVRLREVFDMAGTLRQLGVLPAAGSREERFTTALTNLRTSLRRHS